MRTIFANFHRAQTAHEVLFRKSNGNGGSFVRLALELHGGFVEAGGVLDDGQAQTAAADLAGVAFVHPIETLEHPALILRRDADAGIGYLQG